MSSLIATDAARVLTMLEVNTLINAGPALEAVAKRILRNYPSVSVDSQDVVQDVLCATFKKLTQGVSIPNLDGYLRAGVVNRAVTRAKSLNQSRGVVFELDDGFTGYFIIADQDEPMDLLLEKKEQFDLCRSLLDDREQLVLDMLSEGFSAQDIAEVLCINASHLYVIKHRLRRKFHYLLSEKRAAS